MNRKSITKEVALEMHKEYETGVSRDEIGAKYGFGGMGVYCAFRRFGLKTRSPKDAGKFTAEKMKGDNHWRRKNPSAISDRAYRSQRIVDEDGTVHKRRTHVIVMENHLGRRLEKGEVVHHKNGDRHDNRLENLELMGRGKHTQHEQLLARKNDPQKFIRKRGEGGRYLPEPNLPWSAYNPEGLMPPSLRKVKL
jgi:hypothetical protein